MTDSPTPQRCDADSLAALTQRVAQLERGARRWRLVGSSAVAGLVAMVLTSAARQGADDEILDLVRARRIEIVSAPLFEGSPESTVIAIGSGTDGAESGGGVITMFAPKLEGREEKLQLVCDVSGPKIRLRSKREGESSAVNLSAMFGFGSVQCVSVGKRLIDLTAGPDGAEIFVQRIVEREGKLSTFPCISLGADDSQSRVLLSAPDRQGSPLPLVIATAGSDGGEFSCSNESLSNRARLRANNSMANLVVQNTGANAKESVAQILAADNQSSVSVAHNGPVGVFGQTNGEPVLSVGRTDPKEVGFQGLVSITQGENGGEIELVNKTAEVVGTMRADEYGNGEVGVWNRKGEGRRFTPGP